MITYSDLLTLLTDLKDKGIDTDQQFKEVLKTKSVSIEMLKFINDNRSLDLTNFYKKIRQSYNNKRSKIYIEIVKEIEEPKDVIITSSALLTQILLFSKNVEDRKMFLKHARADEITLVLNNYFKTFDITNAIKLLRIIKSDIKALESIT